MVSVPVGKELIEDFNADIDRIRDDLDKLVMKSLVDTRKELQSSKTQEEIKEYVDVLDEAQAKMFWLACEMTNITSNMIDFMDKFEDIRNNPQISELWQTIESAMALVK